VLSSKIIFLFDLREYLVGLPRGAEGCLIEEISQKGNQLFGHNFNEKLFRGQLSYFEGISYDEQVEYMLGFEAPDEVIKKALVEFSLGK